MSKRKSAPHATLDSWLTRRPRPSVDRDTATDTAAAAVEGTAVPNEPRTADMTAAASSLAFSASEHGVWVELEVKGD
eukprot:7053503-Prymnesium_polylepis.1